MKLIIQADDYGITRSVACGILYGIQKGIIKNTGIFSNMPWAKECVEMIRPYLDQICFGIDLNMVNGPSLLGYKTVPSLCKEDGTFYTIAENKQKDNEDNQFDHVVGEEVYEEFKAQIEHYIKLVGKKPDYIHPHAYTTNTVRNVQLQLAKEYDVMYSIDLAQIPNLKMPDMKWYSFGSPLEQLQENLLDYLVKDENQYLEYDYGYLITHCGYVDAETMKLPFNLCRLKDLEALTSKEFETWMQENNVESIKMKEVI